MFYLSVHLVYIAIVYSLKALPICGYFMLNNSVYVYKIIIYAKTVRFVA